MMTSFSKSCDPDRYLGLRTPGTHEWWYFDAVSDDGRDALVIVWYAALPFDPAYGVATLRHLRRPDRHPAPDPLDHCAIGLSWYRDGQTMAYALNAFRKPAFAARAEPFRVEVAESLLERDETGYRLSVRTPAVDGRHNLQAHLQFRPAARSRPFELDLGSPSHPHLWMLAAADCRAEGTVEVRGPSPIALDFQGRGYHDHNAGSGEISLTMKRWRWGRAHLGDRTLVYYLAEPIAGPARGVRLSFQDGALASRTDLKTLTTTARGRNRFGIPYAQAMDLGDGFACHTRSLVDDGPFYLRWIMNFTTEDPHLDSPIIGIGEWLDTRHLHRPWFNWMIPYRLKRPPIPNNSA